MQTMSKLLYLIEGRAQQWRISLAASAVLAKVILQQDKDSTTYDLCSLRESVKDVASNV